MAYFVIGKIANLIEAVKSCLNLAPQPDNNNDDQQVVVIYEGGGDRGGNGSDAEPEIAAAPRLRSPSFIQSLSLMARKMAGRFRGTRADAASSPTMQRDAQQIDPDVSANSENNEIDRTNDNDISSASDDNTSYDDGAIDDDSASSWSAVPTNLQESENDDDSIVVVEFVIGANVHNNDDLEADGASQSSIRY